MNRFLKTKDNKFDTDGFILMIVTIGLIVILLYAYAQTR